MTTALAEPADGVWLPLAEAAVALHCSTDTVRRRIKTDTIPFRLENGRYLVHLEAHQAGPLRPIVEEVNPTIKAILDMLREDRDLARDDNNKLREENARLAAELVAARAALPARRRWSPFDWVSHLWATQT